MQKQSKYASYGNLKHGMKGGILYERWKGMRSRCANKNHAWYHIYGGKGISVCRRWDDFGKFFEDMYPSFVVHLKKHGEKNTTIERIDGSKGYSPENCKWSTRLEQSNNLSNNIVINLRGEKKTLSQWARSSGRNYMTIYCRLRRGMSAEEAIEGK